jgi:hypothetical protein
MRTTKATTLTTLAGLKRGFAFQAQVNRAVTGLVVATDPPADFLSREQSTLPLPIPEPKPGLQTDRGDRDMRLTGSSGSPTGPVGRNTGATACRTSRTTAARFAPSASARASDYPSHADRIPGSRTDRATPSYRRWHPASVRLSTAGK